MIGLIGATGEIGSQTYQFLKSKANLCLLVRNVNNVSSLISDDVQARKFDFTKFDDTAFNGIKLLLWVLPNNHMNIELDETHWLEVARAASVQHIVKLSVMRASEDDIFHHRQSEENIMNAGIAYTFLRPNTFMQNFNYYEIDDIKYKHQLRFPASQGKTSFIDSRDIAEVAAEILLNPKRRLNKAFTLTGDEALSYFDVANLLSHELKFIVEYIDTTRSLDPEDQYKIQHPFYAALKRNEFSEVTPCVEEILGKPPRRLAQYIKDYKPYFVDN